MSEVAANVNEKENSTQQSNAAKNEQLVNNSSAAIDAAATSNNSPATDNKQTPVKRTPSKRRSFIERAQKESEELVKNMGGSLELEGGRRTRSSTRGTPSKSPVISPPAKKPCLPPSQTTPSRGRGRGRKIVSIDPPTIGTEDETPKKEESITPVTSPHKTETKEINDTEKKDIEKRVEQKSPVREPEEVKEENKIDDKTETVPATEEKSGVDIVTTTSDDKNISEANILPKENDNEIKNVPEKTPEDELDGKPLEPVREEELENEIVEDKIEKTNISPMDTDVVQLEDDNVEDKKPESVESEATSIEEDKPKEALKDDDIIIIKDDEPMEVDSSSKSSDVEMIEIPATAQVPAQEESDKEISATKEPEHRSEIEGVTSSNENHKQVNNESTSDVVAVAIEESKQTKEVVVDKEAIKSDHNNEQKREDNHVEKEKVEIITSATEENCNNKESIGDSNDVCSKEISTTVKEINTASKESIEKEVIGGEPKIVSPSTLKTNSNSDAVATPQYCN